MLGWETRKWIPFESKSKNSNKSCLTCVACSSGRSQIEEKYVICNIERIQEQCLKMSRRRVFQPCVTCQQIGLIFCSAMCSQRSRLFFSFRPSALWRWRLHFHPSHYHHRRSLYISDMCLSVLPRTWHYEGFCLIFKSFRSHLPLFYRSKGCWSRIHLKSDHVGLWQEMTKNIAAEQVEERTSYGTLCSTRHWWRGLFGKSENLCFSGETWFGWRVHLLFALPALPCSFAQGELDLSEFMQGRILSKMLGRCIMSHTLVVVKRDVHFCIWTLHFIHIYAWNITLQPL